MFAWAVYTACRLLSLAPLLARPCGQLCYAAHLSSRRALFVGRQKQQNFTIAAVNRENETFSHDRSKRAYLTRVQTVAGRSMWQVAVCSCVSTVANTDFNQLQPGNVRIEISASLKLRCRRATVANAGAANCCSFSIVA